MTIIKGPRVLTYLALIAGIFSACGKSSQTEPKNIFGRDNRETITSLASPYDAVGRIEESGCSATLIGKTTILTAGHCLWSETSRGATHKELTFSVAVRDGKASAQAKVVGFWLGSDTPESKRTTDFAVARLDRDLSPFSGTVAIRPRLSETPEFTTNLIAYSQDVANGGSPFVHRNCKVMQTDGGRWFHECDGKSGMSGGPLVDVTGSKAAIVGIAVSEYRAGAPDSVTTPVWTKELSNVAVSASQFHNLASEVLSRFDGNSSLATAVQSFKYYSMSELNDPLDQLPDPSPTPPPSHPPVGTPQPLPRISLGDWNQTDPTGIFLKTPDIRLPYLFKTKGSIAIERQNIAGLKLSINSHYGFRTDAVRHLEHAEYCLSRLEYLVDFTGAQPLGYQADQEILQSTYPCIQQNLFLAHSYWQRLPVVNLDQQSRDLAYISGIFSSHRAVFVDLYSVQRDI